MDEELRVRVIDALAQDLVGRIANSDPEKCRAVADAFCVALGNIPGSNMGADSYRILEEPGRLDKKLYADLTLDSLDYTEIGLYMEDELDIDADVEENFKEATVCEVLARFYEAKYGS